MMRKSMRRKVQVSVTWMSVKDAGVISGLIHFSFLIPDEDGSEFERELVEALEGLGVTATAEKLGKVAGYI